MTVARAVFVLGLMVAVGVALVALRTESAKAGNRVLALQQREMRLQQQMWAREMELARLRVPDEIRRRAEELGLHVVPPAAQVD